MPIMPTAHGMKRNAPTSVRPANGFLKENLIPIFKIHKINPQFFFTTIRRRTTTTTSSSS
ncbi:hypothetical protein Sjap_024509 [Stephania japonica]|uniref:Uncharacterized protein n=1 Tax=Stephania japonica TaxID=461633 RepID=A0AAP0HNS7_9MAGN